MRKTINVEKKPKKRERANLEKGMDEAREMAQLAIRQINLKKVRKHCPFCYLEKTFSLDAKISTSYMSN